MKLFVTPRTTTFDTAEIPIAEHVATAMFPHGLPSPSPPPIILSNLHILLDSKPGVVCHKGAFKNEWVEKWRVNGLKPFTSGLYVDLIRSIATNMIKPFGETFVYYSAVPLLRCHPPTVDADALLKPDAKQVKANLKLLSRAAEGLTTRHADGDYGHPTGEINYWFPCNSLATGTNSLHVDSTPWAGKESSRPLELEYGQVGVFYGNQCPHETHKNETGITRCSFDFRIVPGTLFEPMYRDKRSFNLEGGYWTRMEL